MCVECRVRDAVDIPMLSDMFPRIMGAPMGHQQVWNAHRYAIGDAAQSCDRRCHPIKWSDMLPNHVVGYAAPR